VDRVVPSVPGVQVEVLGYDSQMQLTNRSGQTVTIGGYDGEPYARIRADRTVQVNTRSPAYYLNQDVRGGTPVPASARASAPPRWKTLDRAGVFEWHDHRMHWMAKGTPPQVRNRDRRTKVFDYRIPLTVGGRPGAIRGTLFWVGSPTGVPTAAIVSIALIALLGVALVVVVRRRRGRDGKAVTPVEPRQAEAQHADPESRRSDYPAGHTVDVSGRQDPAPRARELPGKRAAT